jgi:hypothetical protein
METLTRTMKTSSRQAFTGSLNDGKNPRFIAINHREVPCTPEKLNKNGKPTAVPFTILRPLSAGFASAPYKMKDQKRDPDAKPLSIMSYAKNDLGVAQPVMTMHSYQKVGISDKGPRSETSWRLSAGNTILLWVDEQRLKEEPGKGDPLLPAGVLTIPPFTVCEISIGPKNEETSNKGSSVKIITVRVATYSLYSLQSDLSFLSSALSDARTLQLTERDAHPMLARDLEVKDVPFLANVSKAAFIDDSAITESAKIVNWGDPLIPQIDVPIDVAMAYTNCSRPDWACALLETAIAASAVKVLVFSSDFWKIGGSTGYKAVPLIDFDVMLAGMEPTATLGLFNTAFRTDVDGVSHVVQVEVSPDPISVQGGVPPACDDFPLAGLQSELKVAHAVAFNLVNTETQAVLPAVWKGFWNASPVKISVSATCAKRKRAATMQE